MDLQRELIESQKRKKSGGIRNASAVSIVAHGVLIGAIVFAGSQSSHKVHAENKIAAFISQGAAPPPPPPPPPPKAAGNTPKVQPKVMQPKVQPQPTFTQPTEIPKEIPKVDPIPMKDVEAMLEQTEPVPSSGADIAGVEGGVTGGVVGGQVGGVVGGVVGGEIGGVVGGQVGGVVGGTGTGTEGTGTGGPEAPVVKEPEPPPPPPPPEPPAGPLRVGGDVKAPVISHREEPEYTEIARQARVQGVVIVEAIIDKNGNVDAVKVVKGLPMGLSEAAVRAVRQWKFKAGTLNGQPVDTIFNLTVNFKLN